ncbi:WYL domain-containing protein [Myxococcota bacterium]|nr:WYL domain-containing protein [Myxococcota bacterium]
MGDTYVRVLAMLREVPPAPRGVDTLTLRRRLADLGFEVDLRTIQRDLTRFSGLLPLICDESERPYRWCFALPKSAAGLPVVEPAKALALCLLERHLATLLPPAVRSALEPEWALAHALVGTAPAPLAGWLAKIAVLPRGPRLVPAKLAAGVLDAVAEALFRDRALDLEYRGRDARAARPWTVSPLGLVSRGPVLYLVACFDDTLAPRQFLAHRIASAAVADAPASRPPGFTLDGYIAGGAFGFKLRDEPVVLVARFEAPAVHHVLETPLADDQEIVPLPGGAVRVQAGVHDTQELRAWLLGLGDLVEVLEPPDLRAEIAGMASRAAALYERDQGKTR